MKYGDELLDLHGPRISVARAISRLSAAPLINFYVGFIFSLWSPVGLGPVLKPLESLLICATVMVVLPVAPILIAAKKGSVDLDVSARENRPKFFAFSLCCYALAYLVYWYLQSIIMSVLAAAYFFVTAGVMVASLRTKVSVHAAGVGGPGIGLIIVYGMPALTVVILWIAVVWARTALLQHTLVQSVQGLLIGVTVSGLVFGLLYATPIF